MAHVCRAGIPCLNVLRILFNARSVMRIVIRTWDVLVLICWNKKTDPYLGWSLSGKSDWFAFRFPSTVRVAYSPRLVFLSNRSACELTSYSVTFHCGFFSFLQSHSFDTSMKMRTSANPLPFFFFLREGKYRNQVAEKFYKVFMLPCCN